MIMPPSRMSSPMPSSDVTPLLHALKELRSIAPWPDADDVPIDDVHWRKTINTLSRTDPGQQELNHQDSLSLESLMRWRCEEGGSRSIDPYDALSAWWGGCDGADARRICAAVTPLSLAPLSTRRGVVHIMTMLSHASWALPDRLAIAQTTGERVTADGSIGACWNIATLDAAMLASVGDHQERLRHALWHGAGASVATNMAETIGTMYGNEGPGMLDYVSVRERMCHWITACPSDNDGWLQMVVTGAAQGYEAAQEDVARCCC
jgi:hypothetical protein